MDLEEFLYMQYRDLRFEDPTLPFLERTVFRRFIEYVPEELRDQMADATAGTWVTLVDKYFRKYIQHLFARLNIMHLKLERLLFYSFYEQYQGSVFLHMLINDKKWRYLFFMFASAKKVLRGGFLYVPKGQTDNNDTTSPIDDRPDFRTGKRVFVDPSGIYTVDTRAGTERIGSHRSGTGGRDPLSHQSPEHGGSQSR